MNERNPFLMRLVMLMVDLFFALVYGVVTLERTEKGPNKTNCAHCAIPASASSVTYGTVYLGAVHKAKRWCPASQQLAPFAWVASIASIHTFNQALWNTVQ